MESAVRQAAAVAIASPDIVRQCLDAGQVVQGTRVVHLTYPVRKTASRAGDVDQPAVR